MARLPRLQWRLALIAVTALAAGGCVGLSIPLGESSVGAPATTGAVKASWRLPQPLPASLAVSDAAAVAQAARRALAADKPVEEWQNPETGSSGRLMPQEEAGLRDEETCRTYVVTVTSIKGVHRYTCRACRGGDGSVTIAAMETAGREAGAGI